MTTLFGQRGQVVGSIDEYAFYDKTGRQLGEHHDGYLFSSVTARDVAKGEWVGSFMNGVVYNSRSYPQAFTENATRGLALVPPRLKSILVNRVVGFGFDVSAEEPRTVPAFLREQLDGQDALLDGIFQWTT